MGGKIKKSTKNFLKNKAKAGVSKKKPFSRTAGVSKKAGFAAKYGHVKEQPQHKAAADMGVDEFLDGGFQDLSGSSDDDDEEEEEGDELGSDTQLSSEEGEEEEGEDEDVSAELGGSAGEAAGEGEEEGEDDDDEEDEEEGGAGGSDPVAADNRQLRGAVGRHRAQLAALKEKDPEFWAYLQQTDADLLGFGAEEGDDDDEEDDEDEDDDDDEEKEEEEEGKKAEAAKKGAAKKAKTALPNAQQKGQQGEDEEGEEEEEEAAAPPGKCWAGARQGRCQRVLVSSQLLAQWVDSARRSASLGAMRQLVRAFRAACRYGDSEQQEEDELRIGSGAVYNAVMLFMLREGDGLFRRLLGLQGRQQDAPLAAEELQRCPRWRKVGPLLKSFLGNSLHALAAMTDAPLQAFTLRRLRASVPLMTPQPLRKFADKLLKASAATVFRQRLQGTGLLVVWGCWAEQGAYRTFLANAKFVSAASAPHIAFMATCCVELWGLDMQASYQHAFSAIRQLAVSLRSALNMKTKDAYKEIYSWQGCNALELWARVLGAHAGRPELRPLVYPLVQLLLGAARLVPTPRFFPLRLRLLRACHRLAAATGLYVPLAAPCLEVLGWAELRKTPKGGAGGSVDLTLTLRAGKTALRNAAFQQEVVEQVLEVLAQHLAQWSCSVALPELSHLSALQLRRFAKTTKVDKFRQAARGLLAVLDRNVAWVGAARDQVDFAPRDLSKVATFLASEAAAGRAPLQHYAQQLAARAAQRAAARSTEVLQFGGKAGKKRGRADSDDEEDADEDNGGNRKHPGKRPGAARQAGNDEDSSGEEEAAPAPRGNIGVKAGAAALLASAGPEAEDLVAEYQLSEEEEEEEEGGGWCCGPGCGQGPAGVPS
ncbi:hypothetical protein QJQ45_022715 [Haematococcus lacustris]|nr:hypothetical protein QJQ45_022715 [Haematococcus lacustris]